jgi:hypothetical protein
MTHLTSPKRGFAVLAAVVILSGCDRGLTAPDLPWDAPPPAPTAASDLNGGIEGVLLADPRPSPSFILVGGKKILDAVDVSVEVDESVFADGGTGWSFDATVHMTGGMGDDLTVDAKGVSASSLRPAYSEDGTFLVVIAVPVSEDAAQTLARGGRSAAVSLSVELFWQMEKCTPTYMARAEADDIIMDID